MGEFNGPFVAYLDNKPVTVLSYYIVDQLKDNTIEPLYNFIFTTTNDIEKEIYGKANNNIKIRFEVKSCNVSTDLLMKFRSKTDYNNSTKTGNIIKAIYEIIKNEVE